VSAEPGDEGLVAMAQGGDRAALERLLGSVQPQVYAVCRRLTGNDADAADASQEALISIVRGLPRFDARARFSTWAYRVAVNAGLDELRRRARRPEPGLPHESPTVALVGGEVGVVERLDVEAALRHLPPEFRAAVVLRDLCQLDYAEIAEVLEIPPGTVRSRISRGRAALVPLLGNPGPAPDRPTESP
jgi:RNA polymerase sigma-70 factor (ECF subfamily)